MNECPHCGSDAVYREEVDVGVGVIYGPYGCPHCGWSEDGKYDLSSSGRDPVDDRGGYLDQWGVYHPPGSVMAIALRAGFS